MSEQPPAGAAPSAAHLIPAPPTPAPLPQGPWVRKVSTVKWVILAIVFVPIGAFAPFVIKGGKRENATTAFDGYGWVGVVGIWLFMVGLYLLIFWYQRREERRARVRGTLVGED